MQIARNHAGIAASRAEIAEIASLSRRDRVRSRRDRDEIAMRSLQSRVRSHKSLRVAKIPTVSHRRRCAIWSGYLARSVLSGLQYASRGRLVDDDCKAAVLVKADARYGRPRGGVGRR